MSASSAIISLLLPGLPATIKRFIISIVVYPAKGHSWRPWPHIVKESLKGIAPTLAHFNAPPAPIGIVTAFWIFASLYSRPPRTEFLGNPSNSGKSMGGFHSSCVLGAEASARPSGTFEQMIRPDDARISTVTSAGEFPVSFAFIKHSNDQSAKALTDIGRVWFCVAHVLK